MRLYVTPFEANNHAEAYLPLHGHTFRENKNPVRPSQLNNMFQQKKYESPIKNKGRVGAFRLLENC